MTRRLRFDRIKVTYPDATEQKFQLRPPDIKQLSEFKHHITTKVFVTFFIVRSSLRA